MGEKTEELVSVVIPVYNRADTIRESIISVLDQSYKNIEIIVIDDGSEDHSEYKIKEIKDQRVKYYRQEKSGACAARNRGILLAQGRYTAFNDSDDIWFRYKLEHQMNALKKYNADIVFGKLDPGKKKGIPDHIREGFLPKDVDLSGIGTQTLLGKTEIFQSDLFDEDLPRFQELELLIRLHLKYSVYCLDEKVVHYRIRPDSISRDIRKMDMAVLKILEKDEDYLNAIPKTKGTVLGYRGTAMAYQGINAQGLFWEAYQLKGRKLDLLKAIMSGAGLLSSYYKRIKK